MIWLMLYIIICFITAGLYTHVAVMQVYEPFQSSSIQLQLGIFINSRKEISSLIAL
jgi:hypothetical protein